MVYRLQEAFRTAIEAINSFWIRVLLENSLCAFQCFQLLPGLPAGYETLPQ